MNKLTIPPKDQFKLEEAKIQGGLFGKIFGTGEHFSKTSLFFILVLLVLVGCFYIFRDLISSLGYWKDIFLPIFTLIAGYFFGQNSKEK